MLFVEVEKSKCGISHDEWHVYFECILHSFDLILVHMLDIICVFMVMSMLMTCSFCKYDVGKIKRTWSDSFYTTYFPIFSLLSAAKFIPYF